MSPATLQSVERILSRHRISGQQLRILELATKAGGSRMVTIASDLTCSSANVVGLVDVLERRELVTRFRGTTDRREVYVKITPEGRKILNAANKEIEKI